MARHRQKRRDADAACDKSVSRWRGNKLKIVGGLGHRDHVACLQGLAHAARTAATCRLVLNCDDVSVTLDGIVAKRIFTLFTPRRAYSHMSAAGKLRQIRARGVAQIEQMNVVGDFFSAFDAEFTHGSDRLPFRRFGLIDLGPGGTPSTV